MLTSPLYFFIRRVLINVADEICNTDENAKLVKTTSLAHAGDLWDAILSMTRKTSKRQSFEAPKADTPHSMWPDHPKHSALATLLGGAVSNKCLKQRKIYIERIMGLPSTTQRALMALIERRKRPSFRKTPTKGKKERTSAKKRSKTETTPTQISTSKPAPQSSLPAKKKVFTPSVPDNGDLPPFSPHDIRRATSESNKKNTPASQARGIDVFATPRSLSGRKGPRRSFEDAFGSTPQLPDPARPSSKRRASENGALFSPGLGDTAEYESEVQGLREKNENLEIDLEKLRQREDELAQKTEDMETNFRKEMMKIEAAARRREDETKEQYENEIEKLKASLGDLCEQCQEGEKAKEELAGLKDEMELMTHTKSMLADTSERLRNYKEKFQQLSDVKEALQREEEAHGKSVEECLRLENELKSLQPLKRQLEEYRSRAVDAEVRFTDCQDELLKLKQEKMTLASSNREFTKGSQAQQEEIEELGRRIQQEEKAKKEAAGVGEGMSELNPELKEEVLRLRNENDQLRTFAAKRERDSVYRLEQDLEDATRLSVRFKSQFLSTKGQLEATQADLKDSRSRGAKLEKGLAEWTRQAKAAETRADGLAQELEQCSKDLKDTKTREENLEKELAEWVEQANISQKRVDELSERLQICSEDLEATRGRELGLKQEVAESIQRHDISQENAKELTDQLRKVWIDLTATRDREALLEKNLMEWTRQATSSQERANELSEALNQCTTELQATRSRESNLEAVLAEVSSEALVAQDQAYRLSQQLDKCTLELEENQRALQESQERELTLQNDLTDMTVRAEDSEAVSKQRMELVQSTREKLAAAQLQAEELEKREEELVSEVSIWTDKTHDLEKLVESLENDLKETRETIENNQEVLATSQLEVAKWKSKEAKLISDLESWTDKASAAENLTERLQEELVQTRDLLNTTQHAQRTAQEGEEMCKQQVAALEEMNLDLEEGLEVAIKERQEAMDNAKEKLQNIREELSTKAEEEIESVRFKLTARLDEEIQTSSKYKQDFFQAQETLNEIQGSLGASQHREKMLKLELTKLEDAQKELEVALEDARKKTIEAGEESIKSLEATREVLHAKAKKDMNELQNNMNLLLEGERKAKCQVNEAWQVEMQKLREETERQAAELKEQAEKALNDTKEGGEKEIQGVRADCNQQIETVKKAAAEGNEKLIAKGKEMLKDVRKKARDQVEEKQEDLDLLQERFDKIQEENETISNSYKTKVAEYKKKLQFASSRISGITQDGQELQETIKDLEREKFKLQEENERYRRQVGGRFGADAKVQNQLEMLQKEFKNALEEIRELKRKLNSRGFVASSALPSIDESDENVEISYSRDAVNSSTLVELRTEYEETIEALNDEKRELVMRNSAAITDVQKAEKRAWEADEENATVKQELTSLKLQVERLGHKLSTNQELSTNRSFSQELSHMGTATTASLSGSLGEVRVRYPTDENERPSGKKSIRSPLNCSQNDDWDPVAATLSSPSPGHKSGVLSPSQAYFNEVNRGRLDFTMPSCVPHLKKSPGPPTPSSVPHFSKSVEAGIEAQPHPSLLEYQTTSPGKDGPPECKQC
jgi:chromosome segregation ATPase